MSQRHRTPRLRETRGAGFVERGQYHRDVGIKKALDVSTSLSVTKSYVDLEQLISHWSVGMHTLLHLERVHSNTGACRGDISLAIIRRSQCNGCCFEQGGREKIASLRVLNKLIYTS